MTSSDQVIYNIFVHFRMNWNNTCQSMAGLHRFVSTVICTRKSCQEWWDKSPKLVGQTL